jgi:hypothetical protein
MKPNPIHRLPAPLEAAVQSLKLAARDAVERTIESLGLSALAAGNAFQRDGLLGAQFELNRKSAVFILSFNDAFDERVLREIGGAPSGAEPPPTAWDALSLVEDHDVEVQISAERFGMDVAHACEWELRELNAFVGALLGYGGSDKDRNPLRPEIVGHAMILAIEAVSERAEIRKLLAAEISRSLRGILRSTYAEIVADLRNAGIRPLGMSMRSAPPRQGDSGRAPSAFDGASRAARLEDARTGHGAPGMASGGGGFGHSTRFAATSQRSAASLGQVDPALMALIRRLAFRDDGSGGDAFGAGRPAGDGGYGAQLATAGYGSGADPAGSDRGPALPNLIAEHRDELRQASRGSIDHMVIDVIAGLFDQILSDPKVPPQMARQIARLQLPVLRAALGDSSFFSSRRHPVRRFINRIASLGASFEDFNDASAQRFLAKVRALVQEVVEGDFDQIETYESKLRALEGFMAELTRSEVQEQGPTAELLSQKEDELRLRQLYAQRLEGELKSLAAPEFVRDFISRVWSQVLLRAADQGGADGALAQRLRSAGRELFMSVQPKATPAARKVFLAELPRLMQDLTDGMNLIRWPEAQRRAFFGLLMPAHAEALKAGNVRQLDINLMARQVEGALQKPLPSRDDLKAAPANLPTLTEELSPASFTPEEARQVGLVDESAVDWSAPAAALVDIELEAGSVAASASALASDGTVDIDISLADAPLPPPSPAAGASAPAAKGPAGPPLPADPAEAAEPTQGRALAEHVQIGFAYQMQLAGQWQKVRLSHVSPGRSFFVFTHGSRHKQTISLTQRMLVRLCESGRLRAFENGYLIERATARARRQLSSLSQPA